MSKLVYVCNYDGNICDKEIPKVDNDGVVLPPNEIDKKAHRICESYICWESCVGCKRNFSMSTAPSGRLEIRG